MRRSRAAVALGCAAAALASGVAAASDAPSGGETRTVAAGERYAARAFHRVLFGSGYRDLWTTPIEVPVLDLARFSGGLTPKKKTGAKQTLGLKLEGRDGRAWKFRSIDKNPTAVLPKGLRHNALARHVVQDTTSTGLPAGVLVVDRLEDALGILHVGHRLVVMPDDPALGEFREAFAGVLGTLEESARIEAPATPGFESFRELADTQELKKRLDAESAQRVDPAAFLTARLFDVWIGDYDRHDLQWEWALCADGRRWLPVPVDRDAAFVDFEGIFSGFVRSVDPRFVRFESSFPSLLGLTWSGRFLDRRHLTALDWPDWEHVVETMTTRLTDAVIDDAVAQLPREYAARVGARLASALRARRERLPRFARDYYEMLAREPEIHGSDEPDSVVLTHRPDGSVEVAASGPEGPYFRRTFRPSETREVRIFTKGGDDRAVSEGATRPRVAVRLVGGEGDDALDDSAGGYTLFYDSSGESRVVRGPGTREDSTPYVAPLDADGDPPRDWGGSWSLKPSVSLDGDYGALLRLTETHDAYGFRAHPFESRHAVSVDYATALGTGSAEYEYRALRTDSTGRFDVVARVSRLDFVHYHGLGNETADSGGSGAYDVRQTRFELAPSYRLPLRGIDVWVAPVVTYAGEATGDGIAAARPYGTRGFGQLGARASVTLDRHAPQIDERHASAAGFDATFGGSFQPAAWDVTDAFGDLHADAHAELRLSLPLEPTIALHAGGRKLFGRYPIFEAAAIGGADTVRGLEHERFLGDASAYGGAELRLLVRRDDAALFSRVGVLGLVDTGRVFLAGVPSDRWHAAAGGGVWLSFVDPGHTLFVTVARALGRTRVYAGGGFAF